MSPLFAVGVFLLFLLTPPGMQSLSLKPSFQPANRLDPSISTAQRHHHLLQSPFLIPRGGGAEPDEDIIDLDNSNRVPNETSETDSGSSSSPRMASSVSSPGALTGALSSLCALYSNALEVYPILTKSVTAAILFDVSDQMAQMIEMRNKRKKNDKAPNPSLSLTDKKRSIYSGIGKLK